MSKTKMEEIFTQIHQKDLNESYQKVHHNILDVYY